jgi:hypothetical protein
MRDESTEDQDQDGPVGEIEILIFPGGQVVMPRLPRLAGLALELGDQNAADACLAARNMNVIVGSPKCG